jgi:hypothetical protein
MCCWRLAGLFERVGDPARLLTFFALLIGAGFLTATGLGQLHRPDRAKTPSAGWKRIPA